MSRDAPLVAAVGLLLVAGLLLPAITGPALGASGASTQPDVNRSTNGYTLAELSRTVSHSGAPPSVRRWGEDGQIWLRHVPVGLLVPTDPSEGSRYIEQDTVVRRDTVYIGSFRGWEAQPENLTLHIVTYNRGQRLREGPNGTAQQVQVPVNVTEKTVEVTLSGGGYDRAEVKLPEFYDRQKRVTMWVEGKRDSQRWNFYVKTSKATQAVALSSRGDAIKWSIWNIFIWVLLTAGLLVGAASWAIKKVGRGPQWGPLEYGFIAFASLFFGGFLLYNGIMDTLARRPQLIGVAGGVLLGGLVLRALSEPGEEALFIQPTHKTEEVRADGSGSWWWANRVHPVVTRESDDKKVIPRRGWIPFFAALWPGYDARPVLEFEGRPERTLDSPPDEDGEELFPEDDAGVLERVRTKIEGNPDKGDEYETIYLVDPLAEDVVTYEEEAFEFALPTLVSWPDDKDSGVWIRDVPLPSIAVGKILGGIVAVTVSFAAVKLFTASGLLASIGAGVALLALVVKPTEGSATVSLAPAQFDGVLQNVISTLGGWSDLADADYFRDEYHRSEAKRRVERQERQEADSVSVFDEMADRMAPDSQSNGDSSQPTGAAQSEVSADD